MELLEKQFLKKETQNMFIEVQDKTLSTNNM